MELFWHNIAHYPFGIHAARNCCSRLVCILNGFCPASKPVYHCENKLRRRPKRERALAIYNIDVKRTKRLIGLQMTQLRVRRKVRVSFSIAHFAGLDKHRHVTTDERPPKAFSDATQSGFLAVVSGLM